jgi:hypothetical protein
MVATMKLEKEPTGNQVSPLSPVTPGLQPAQSHPNPHTAIGTHDGPRPGAGRPKGVPNKVTQTSSCGAGRRGVRQRPADVVVSWVSNGRRISKPFSAGYCKLFIDTPVNLELGAAAGV